MDTTHRKIELQAPADLTYLISNASRAARSKIDLHFPPNAAPEGEEDGMRKRVEELVDQYIQRTFSNVKPNLCINGMDAAELERHLGVDGGDGTPQQQEEIEAYDHRLARRIQDASTQIEALTLELATLRRTAPGDAAGRLRSEWERDGEGWDGRLREAREKSLMGAEGLEFDVVGLEREEEMRRTWEMGTRTLVGVKEEIGGTVAKLERAQSVVAYLEGR